MEALMSPINVSGAAIFCHCVTSLLHVLACSLHLLHDVCFFNIFYILLTCSLHCFLHVLYMFSHTLHFLHTSFTMCLHFLYMFYIFFTFC